MSANETRQKERWLDSLRQLGVQRGDASPVIARAEEVCRTLGVSPWIALAVAEGLVNVRDAVRIDRAAKCKHLQSAVLDQRIPLQRLEKTMPYAVYFLASDIMAAPDAPFSRLTEAVDVARAMLEMEQGIETSVTRTCLVRAKSDRDYLRMARTMADYREHYNLDLAIAVEIGTGRITLQQALYRQRMLSPRRLLSTRVPRERQTKKLNSR